MSHIVSANPLCPTTDRWIVKKRRCLLANTRATGRELAPRQNAWLGIVGLHHSSPVNMIRNALVEVGVNSKLIQHVVYIIPLHYRNTMDNSKTNSFVIAPLCHHNITITGNVQIMITSALTTDLYQFIFTLQIIYAYLLCNNSVKTYSAARHSTVTCHSVFHAKVCVWLKDY